LAGEDIVLKTGFRLRADRHEITGGMIHLYNGSADTVFPWEAVEAIEPDDYVAPPEPEPKITPPAAARGSVRRIAQNRDREGAGSLAAPGAEATNPDPKELVTQAALRHGLPPDLVHSVAQVESGYRQDAVSPKGAIGLMQLMPQTARELRVDPSNPEQNADAGARYLRELLLKYLDDPYQLRKALAAYNAGPAAVDRYKGIPPYPETINYVRKVLEGRNKYAR
jgi:soluble lytic murein transglycosylase-like protein